MWLFLKNFLSACFGVICTLITLSQFFLRTNTYQDFAKKYSLPTKFSSKEVAIFAIILSVLIFIFELCSYIIKSKHSKKAGVSFHRFNHKIRDHVFSTESPECSKNFNNHETYYKQAGNDCEELCEYIASFIKENTGKEFSVCIKLLQSATASSVNGTVDTCAYTFCRSGKNKIERKENGIALKKGALTEQEIFTPITMNTAFKYIIENEYNDKVRRSIFACSNLIMLKILNFLLRREQYQNPNKHFWKHYLSTIVVPIRIKPELIQYDFKDIALNGYLTLGFLCLDYRWPISKALKDELCGYANGFSDALFNLLYKTYKCDKRIADGELARN